MAHQLLRIQSMSTLLMFGIVLLFVAAMVMAYLLSGSRKPPR